MAKSDKAAQQRLKDAREDLERVSAGTTEETPPAYTKANDAVIEAEKALPWWKR
jgi:hypothetical protein